MPRMIRHDLNQPIKIEPQDKPIWVCACGLSKNLPHCDGSHKVCTAENDSTLYVYNASRDTVVEERADTLDA
jgi:CDGSH-type Zn-finger protein